MRFGMLPFASMVLFIFPFSSMRLMMLSIGGFWFPVFVFVSDS